MDAKTFEYMKERTAKYSNGLSVLKQLEDINASLKVGKVENILIRDNYKSIPKPCIGEVSDAIKKAIDVCISQVKKEMEEI